MLAKHLPAYIRLGSNSSLTLTTGIVTLRPLPNWSVLAGSRSAVIGLAQNLALDLKPLRVNAVMVGAVDTEIWSGLEAEQREKLFKSIVGRTMTGKVAKPEDVAEAYLYCMKDGNVTGSVVRSDGGMVLN